MSAPTKAELRRGWCPSTLRPMETGDGWLVRLHPPGGRLSPAQLRRVAALARRHGNGLIEISARANLQIRGVTAQTHPALVASLLSEGLVDEHGRDGPQRLTLVSPLAGDGGEPSDAIALAERIEAAARGIAGLPAKIGVVLDDGSTLPLDGFPADIRIVAVAQDKVTLGLPQDIWLGPIRAADAPQATARLLEGFLAHHRRSPQEIRRLRDLPETALSALAMTSDLPRCKPPLPRPAPTRAGLFPWCGERFAAIIGLPFGRSDAATLDRLCVAANAAGHCDIRLSPWRGIAFRGLGRSEAVALLRCADDLGLVTRDDDPRLSVQACAGSPACRRAERPTMVDAARLADAAAPLLAAGLAVHVSGCVKGCAHPSSADLTLVAREGRYGVVIGGTTRDAALAELDLSEVLARLQPGQEIHARLVAAGRLSGRDS